MSYKEELELVRNTYDRWAAEAYDIEGCELEEQFDEFATFAIENLSRFAAERNVPHVYFYYHINNTVNGYGGVGIVGPLVVLYRGVVDALLPVFRERSAIYKEKAYADYGNVVAYLGGSLDNFLYRVTMLFSFYHERTHVIQDLNAAMTVEEDGERQLSELYSPNIHSRPYEEDKHVYELDADLEGGRYAVDHIIQTWNNSLGIENLEKMIGLGIAGIMTYLLHLCNGNYQLYLKQGDHPHTVVRLLYIATDMVEYAMHQIQQPLNGRRVLHTALHATERFFQLNDNNSEEPLTAEVHEAAAVEPPLPPVRQIEKVLKTHKKDIENYVNELLQLSKRFPGLAIHERSTGKP